MSEKPLSDHFEIAPSDTLKEILRQAEAHLQAQLTAAIAADHRAYTFAGLCVASVVLLMGSAYGLVIDEEPDVYIASLAFLVGIGLFVSAWLAVISARATNFDFCGSRPGVWISDIEEKKSIERSFAEQCEHCDKAISSNRITMERNSKTFNVAVNVALSSVGIGSIAVLYWAAERF